MVFTEGGVQNSVPLTNEALDPSSNPSGYNGCEVSWSSDLGRFLVANRSIKKGEILVEEEAIFAGPNMSQLPVCLGCLQDIEPTNAEYRCPRCYWPLCGPDCPDIYSKYGHSPYECWLFAQKDIGRLVSKWSANEQRIAYDAVLHIRCLLLKVMDKDRLNMLLSLESHDDLRTKSLRFEWTCAIIDCIRTRWNIGFNPQEIYSVSGILQINMFHTMGYSAGAVFYRPSFFAHDCSPNASWRSPKNHFTMEIYALRDIEKGESVTICYAEYFMPTLLRRIYFNELKFFWCKCRQCADPTEFATFASALYCTDCSKGPVLPVNSLDPTSEWKCWQCSRTRDSVAITEMLSGFHEELRAIDDEKGCKIFLKKCKGVLGSNHYFVQSAKDKLQAIREKSH